MNEADFLTQYVEAHDHYQCQRAIIAQRGAGVFRNVRKGLKLSLHKAAKELGVTASYLSKVENGHIPLSAELARGLVALHEAERVTP